MDVSELNNRKHIGVRELVGEPESIDASQWKYAVGKDKSIISEGREIKMVSGEDFYGGKFVRDLIESRKYRPKAYTWLGYIEDPKKGVSEIGIPFEDFYKHTAIFGKSGSGKSTVMKNMLLQWAQAGYGLCFVDPKGEDSPAMLDIIPEERKDDVIWIEPGTEGENGLVGLNILDVPDYNDSSIRNSEINILVEHLVEIFEKKMGEDMWSAQIEGVLTSILSVLVESNEHYTIADLYKILKDQSEREVFVERYEDDLGSMSIEYIKDLDPNSIDPLIQELKRNLSNEAIRSTISQKNSKITVSEIIDGDKILLCNFSNVSDRGLKFLVAVLVKRIWAKIKSRPKPNDPNKKRRPFYLCIDEVDDATKDMSTDEDLIGLDNILSTARSFKLPLILATQQPSQLAEDIKKYVFGCNNIFSFHQDHGDADELSQRINDDEFDPYDMMELPSFHLVGQVHIGDSPTGLIIKTFPQYPPLRNSQESNKIVTSSIEKYGTGEVKEFNEDDYGVIRMSGDSNSDNKEEEVTKVDLGRDGYITTYHSILLMKSIALKKENNLITDTDMREVFQQFIGTTSNKYETVKNETINPLVGSKLDQVNYDDFKITKEGEDYITDILTKSEKIGFEVLSNLGYNITKPIMSIDSIFDFVGNPPVLPVEEARTMSEAKKLESVLEQNNPIINKISKDNKIVITIIEKDKIGIEKAAKNLAKSRQGVHNMVITINNNDEELEKSLGINNSKQLIKKQNGDSKYLYNGDMQLPVEENKIPVLTNSYNWIMKGDKIYLISDGNKIMEFENYNKLDTQLKKEDIKFFAEKEDDKLIIKTMKNGEEKDVKTIKNTEQALKQLNIIKKPINPKLGEQLNQINEDNYTITNIKKLKELA